eukprot:GHVT01102038.1.p1 GENE.GHVT01102038.1~~GHVT01102038.1.p1  ORF type:complete len:354 (+),score=72.53 GHVT01102038.1:278-1339(+)
MFVIGVSHSVAMSSVLSFPGGVTSSPLPDVSTSSPQAIGLGGGLGGLLRSRPVVDRSAWMPNGFDSATTAGLRCRLRPVVALTILDAYVRREESQTVVIGTLLGIVSEGSVVDITDCFVDRHSLTEEGLLQIIKDHHESMYELKQQVSPKEQVVGWFCTGSQLTELTCAVHGWFKQISNVSKFVPQPPLVEPLHLMLDTELTTGSLGIKAFLQVPMQIVRDNCFQFQELPLEMHSSTADRAGIACLLKALATKNASRGTPRPRDGFEGSLQHLLGTLEKLQKYVQAVLDGTQAPDAEVGRFLSKSLDTNARQNPTQFAKLFKTSTQDNLMAAYLANLAGVQFSLAERVNSSFF